MKIPVGILISGRGSNMTALINAAAVPDYPAEIRLIVSNRVDAAGLELAQAAGLPTSVIENRKFGRDRAAHEAAINNALCAAGCEIICLAGYMRILTPFLVQKWPGRLLNIHPSLLPAFPGLDTHARALAAGAISHGCTVHLVTDTLDGGPILAQAAVPVLDDDTESRLAARVLAEEHRVYPTTLAAYIRNELPASLPLYKPCV